MDKKSKIQYALNLIFSSNFLLVTLAVHLHPTQRSVDSPFKLIYLPYFLSLFTTIALFILYRYLLQTKNTVRKNKIFGISFLVQMSAYIGLGLLVHFDFYTLVFQIMFIYASLFLFSLLKANSANIRLMNIIIRTFHIFTAGILFWTILMGYAIQTGESERWIEEIIFNTYNLLLLLFVAIYVYSMKHRLYTHIQIKQDKVVCNNLDITEIIGKRNTAILHSFVKNKSMTYTCSDIFYLLNENEEHSILGCEECRKNDWKVTRCTTYKNTYNSILFLKKVLESLDIGTFHYPYNKIQIKDSGWRLEFKPHVEVIR